MHGSDRRRANRVSLGSVDVRLSGTRGSLIDVSVIGALVQFPLAPLPDHRVVFQMDAAGAPVELQARVVRTITDGTGDHRVALEFEELSMDAIVLLSRLVDEDRDPGMPETPSQPRAAGWWS
jgi:hypothetical protein